MTGRTFGEGIKVVKNPSELRTAIAAINKELGESYIFQEAIVGEVGQDMGMSYETSFNSYSVFLISNYVAY